jgi:hypothetical protein
MLLTSQPSSGEERMSSSLLPVRRIAVQYVVFAAVVAAGGVVESWGSSLALIVLVVSVPFGVWADRSERPRLAKSLDVITPGGVLESPARTALRTLSVMGVFALFVVIGAFVPFFGSLAGGAMVGIALSHLRALRQLLRLENRLGCRLIARVPARINMGRRMPTPVLYRDRP